MWKFFGVAVFSVQAQGAALLDYYPDCNYRIATSVSASGKVSMANPDDGIARILRKLTQQAQDVENSLGTGSTGVVITRLERKIVPGKHGKKTEWERFSYEAEVLTGCSTWQNASEKLAPYNQFGQAQRAAKPDAPLTLDIAVKIEAKTKKLAFRTPASKEVSLNNGVYGIPLGTTRQQFEQKMGQANFHLQTQSGVILGYGRKHSYHFNDNKLTKAEYANQYLSQELVNHIEPRAFFDDPQWQLDGKYPYRTMLKHIPESKLTQRNEQAVLNLITDRFRSSDAEVSQRLTGFELVSKHHESYAPLSGEDLSQLSTIVLNRKNQLPISPSQIQWLKERAVALITVNPQTTWLVFSNSIAVRLNHGLIDQVHMATGMLKAETQSTQWNLSEQLHKGMNLSALKRAFPEHTDDIYEGSDKLNLYGDNWDLVLYMDERGLLDEARFSFY